jgi:hypothetical protein
LWPITTDIALQCDAGLWGNCGSGWSALLHVRELDGVVGTSNGVACVLGLDSSRLKGVVDELHDRLVSADGALLVLVGGSRVDVLGSIRGPLLYQLLELEVAPRALR